MTASHSFTVYVHTYCNCSQHRSLGNDCAGMHCLQKISGQTAEPKGVTERQVAADGTERQEDKQEGYHKLVPIRVKSLCVSRAQECILRVTFDHRSAPSHKKASPYTYRNRRHTPDTALMLQTTCTQL